MIEPASTLDVAVYLSFFPHVVAGPIVRAQEFLPQLDKPRNPCKVAVGAGVALIALGLVKKVVVADYLARVVVDPVFGVPEAYAAPDVALAVYAYAAQIYCDFSGYTDIAIGLALLMGFVFPQNFNWPYRALSFREFWRRWHMTLSRFLRDFLYIPLGGNRRASGRLPQPDDHDGAGRALARRGLGVRALGHPARGVPCGGARAGRPRGGGCPWVAWLVTFHIVVFGWILFRAERLELAAVFSASSPPGAATLWTPVTAGAIVAVVGFQLLPRARSTGCASASPGCPRRARRGARDGDPAGGRDGAEPGRAPLHLLPVLTEPTTHRARAARPPARRARRLSARTRSLWCSSRSCCWCFRGPVDPRRGRADGPGRRARAHAGDRQAGGLGRGSAAVRRLDRRRARLPRGRRRGRGRQLRAAGSGSAGRGVPAVPPASFDPAELGGQAASAGELGTLLVTGDSLSMPLDIELARRLGDTDVDVERDPHVGTGISKTGLVDWGRLSAEQVGELGPTPLWCSSGRTRGSTGRPGRRADQVLWPRLGRRIRYRVRRMMNTYRRGGRARVYWLTLPAPRDGDRQEIARSVNAAIEVAAPYRAQVRVLDMGALFTPGGRYRDAMTIDGRRQIVRESDGIHLNGRGSELAADAVLEAVRQDFPE